MVEGTGANLYKSEVVYKWRGTRDQGLQVYRVRAVKDEGNGEAQEMENYKT